MPAHPDEVVQGFPPPPADDGNHPQPAPRQADAVDAAKKLVTGIVDKLANHDNKVDADLITGLLGLVTLVGSQAPVQAQSSGEHHVKYPNDCPMETKFEFEKMPKAVAFKMWWIRFKKHNPRVHKGSGCVTKMVRIN